MKQLDQLLAESPFFTNLGGDMPAVLAGCAHNVHFDTDEYVFHTGEFAERCYVIRHGRVALELVGSGGRRVVVRTIDAGDLVGLSWLVPPYRWYLDARAVEPTSAISLDAGCLRAKCEEDPRIGYKLMQRVAHAMYERMQGNLLQILDVYRIPDGR
jgi:CRP-like cAMP-binding protein